MLFLSRRNSRPARRRPPSAPGLPAQVFDLAAGCRSRCVACKAPFSGLQELLRPSVIQALGDALTPAEFRNAVFATQAVQHNADFLLAEYCLRVARRMSFTIRSEDILGLLISGSSPLLDGYDEPEILPSSSRQFCLTSADAGQVRLLGASRRELLHL